MSSLNVNNGNHAAVDDDDHDSTFGDNQSSLTTSVTPSVFEYRYENGRRYHAYSERTYPLPNDEIEKDRLDLQHHAFRLTLDGKLYRAPLRNDVQHVLDVGTGTGIWAIEFCDLHPSAQVIGTDLSPIQPEAVPPNCSFLIDDCEQDWLFHHEFDFIHTRALVAAIKDWPRFFTQAYENLAPGGYLELQEIPFPAMCVDTDLTPETSPLLRWSAFFIEAAAQIGVDATAPLNFGTKLHETGFIDVKLKVYRWPAGQWAKGDKWKSLGKFAQEDLMDFLSSGSLALFTRVLGWSRERVELFLAEVRRELKMHKERHFYANVMIWYAKKPRRDEEWNPTSKAYTLEESILLEVDDGAGETRAAQTSANYEPLRSPGVLVTPTAELSLATASSISTPTESKSYQDSEHDSSDASTIHSYRIPTVNRAISSSTEGSVHTRCKVPGYSYTTQHTCDDTTSAPASPKTTKSVKTNTGTVLPPTLDIMDGAVNGDPLMGARSPPETKPLADGSSEMGIKERIDSTVKTDEDS